MSDFITGLRGDVVEAAARHGRRGRLRRAAPTPRTVAVALATAASIAVVALVVAALAPRPEPARPRVVAIVPVGGVLVDGAIGDGSLWVTDFNRRVARIDLETHRVIARIGLADQPEAIGALGDDVWARTGDHDSAALGTRLIEIDPRTNHVTARATLGGGAGLTVARDAVWAPRRFTQPEGIDRIDPRTGAVTDRVRVTDVDGVALQGTTLWSIGHDGTLAVVDTTSGRIRQRWPDLAPLADAGGTNAHALAPDADGTWVVSSGKAALLRVAAGRVVQRFSVDKSVRPLLARTEDRLWIVTGADVIRESRLSQIDPETGRTTATIDIGAHRPIALVGSARALYVVAADGNVLVIRA